MKDTLFHIKKKFLFELDKAYRKFQRKLVNNELSYANSFEVPIIINNRNRLTFLKKMVDWLQQAGYKNIVILDNDSSYPPLLKYYESTTAKVIFLKKNVGYMALWQIDFFKTIKKHYYVYTDSDLIPTTNCPNDLVYRLYKVLHKHNIEKCGPALRIDNLPDYYIHKQKVLDIENKYWKKRVEEDVFEAPIDTTFALYKPFAKGNAEQCTAFRVAGNLIFEHLPWYENSAELNEEASFYKENVSSSSYWYSK